MPNGKPSVHSSRPADPSGPIAERRCARWSMRSSIAPEADVRGGCSRTTFPTGERSTATFANGSRTAPGRESKPQGAASDANGSAWRPRRAPAATAHALSRPPVDPRKDKPAAPRRPIGSPSSRTPACPISLPLQNRPIFSKHRKNFPKIFPGLGPAGGSTCGSTSAAPISSSRRHLQKPCRAAGSLPDSAEVNAASLGPTAHSRNGQRALLP
jgi:hypothetical protein